MWKLTFEQDLSCILASYETRFKPLFAESSWITTSYETDHVTAWISHNPTSDGGVPSAPYQQFPSYPGVAPQLAMPNMMPPMPSVPVMTSATGVVSAYNPMVNTAGVCAIYLLFLIISVPIFSNFEICDQLNLPPIDCYALSKDLFFFAHSALPVPDVTPAYGRCHRAS